MTKINRLQTLILLLSLLGCNSTKKDNVRNNNTENHSFDSEYRISQEDSVLLKRYNSDKKHAILIKGKIENSTEVSWVLKNDGFLGHQSIEISIQPDGSFRQILPIEGLANLYLMLNRDAININAEPNNIIVVNWDEKDFDNTFNVGSPNESTNNNLQFNLLLHEKFRGYENQLHQRINENRFGTKDKVYHEINDLFNSELAEIIDSKAKMDLFFFKIFYKFQGYLFDAKLLNNNKLQLNKVNSKDKTLQSYLSTISSNKFLSNQLFYQCPEYREFLYRYISSEKLFEDVRITNSMEMKNPKGELIKIPYTQTKFCDFENDRDCSDYLWAEYLKAFSQTGISSIRDWYITYFLIRSFKSQPFNKVETIFNDFSGKCLTPVYRDTLISTHQYYKKMNSGIKAPEFTLSNEKGQLVSLSDFNGKVIYLDFWGASCAPCLNDIRKHIPGLHKRYERKDVVFINICVDSNEGKWRNSLSELKIGGINLIAEGFTTNKVCKDYNIDAVPHYLIIDKDGRLNSTRAPGPSELLNTGQNDIDKLLIK